MHLCRDSRAELMNHVYGAVDDGTVIKKLRKSGKSYQSAVRIGRAVSAQTGRSISSGRRRCQASAIGWHVTGGWCGGCVSCTGRQHWVSDVRCSVRCNGRGADWVQLSVRLFGQAVPFAGRWGPWDVFLFDWKWRGALENNKIKNQSQNPIIPKNQNHFFFIKSRKELNVKSACHCDLNKVPRRYTKQKFVLHNRYRYKADHYN